MGSFRSRRNNPTGQSEEVMSHAETDQDAEPTRPTAGRKSERALDEKRATRTIQPVSVRSLSLLHRYVARQTTGGVYPSRSLLRKVLV